jgi:phage FluMu protein Com
MPIHFRCACCNQLLGIARRKAGMMVRCPKCQGQVAVPTAEGVTSAHKPPAETGIKKGDSSHQRDNGIVLQEPPDDGSRAENGSTAAPAPPVAAAPPSLSLAKGAVAFDLPPRVRRAPYELIFALIVMATITVWYVNAAQRGVPQPGGVVGHSLGVVGFLLMLSAETLYSLRKRIRGFTLGPTGVWLRVHIFTGLVGPYLVLLHSAGKFNGLAGVLSLLTVLMVLSGFVGRYIYTAVPRTLDGAEVAVGDLEARIAAADRQLQARRLDPSGAAAQAAELEKLEAERSRLQRQVRSLATGRRLLALWHLFHIPLGVALFALAFIHIGAALYYATFLK